MHSLTQLFADSFAHLGVDAVYQPRGEAAYPMRVLLKQPDLSYGLGEAHMVRSVFQGEVLCSAVPNPQMGDQLIIKDQSYVIYQEPLRDPSQTVWKLHAMLREMPHA